MPDNVTKLKLPRGIRNNNPGNIERNTTSWKGLKLDQSSDSRFCVFMKPEYGIRAMMKIIITYQKKYGLMTVREIINRWAPPHENDTESYVNNVARKLDVKPDAGLSLVDIHGHAIIDNMDLMIALVQSITVHENGYPRTGFPEYWYEKEVWEKAFKLI